MENGFGVVEYMKTNSCTRVQRGFKKRLRTDPPPRSSIQRSSDNFENQGCICKKKNSDRPHVSDESVRQVGVTFNRSPTKSVRKGSRELQMPKTIAWHVLRRRVHMKPYYATLPNRCIGRTGAADEVSMKWPPRSPDLTPYEFFLWGYIREQVLVPPLQLDIDELKLIINHSYRCT
jgi:hypothetical protein